MTDRDFYGNIFIYNVALIYATGDRPSCAFVGLTKGGSQGFHGGRSRRSLPFLFGGILSILGWEDRGRYSEGIVRDDDLKLLVPLAV